MIPFRRILAAVDFSPGCQPAFRLAERLARHCGAELQVLHAVSPSLIAAARAQDFDLRTDIHQELRRFVAATASVPTSVVRYHLVDGEAASVIVQTAQRERANLIVMGLRGLSEVDWPALGGTLDDVLRLTAISVLAVPPSWSPIGGTDLAAIGPVIAGVNMTCPSIEAASAACRLAAILHTQAILIHAVPPPQVPERWRQYSVAAAEHDFATSNRDVEGAVEAIKARSPVVPSFHTEPGDVARVLVESARKHPDGIVVLGRGRASHAYGPPGSIVARTLTLGQVPVLMHVSE